MLRRSHRHADRRRNRKAILAEGTPSEAAWALIEAANQAGGLDNVSVVVVVVEP